MSHILPVAELIEQVAHLAPSDRAYFENEIRSRQKPEKPRFSKEESAILLKINRGFAVEKWERLQFLTEKMEADKISEAENLELEMLAAAYETFTVDRLEWMLELAKIRKITLPEVIELFELQSK